VFVDALTGCYVAITTLSLNLAFRGNTPTAFRWTRAHSVTIIYTIVMLVITLAWFIATAHNLASVLVQCSAPHQGPVNGQLFFSPDNRFENALASLQYLSSDALMVCCFIAL
jgi:hypothetical protein